MIVGRFRLIGRLCCHQEITFKKIIIVVGFIFLFFGCNSDQISGFINQYELHLEDLSFYSTNGYKSNFEDIDIQGTLSITNYPLDCAILGSGFFCFSEPGIQPLLYTRNGALEINREGFLINEDGFYLEPRVQFPYDLSGKIQDLSINLDGDIIFTGADPDKPFDRIHVYNRTDDEYIKQGNYFLFKAVEEVYDRTIISEALEMCNYSLRSKLQAMKDILYQLKRLDSDNRYDFQIHLINELLFKQTVKKKADANNELEMAENDYVFMLSLDSDFQPIKKDNRNKL